MCTVRWLGILMTCATIMMVITTHTHCLFQATLPFSGMVVDDDDNGHNEQLPCSGTMIRPCSGTMIMNTMMMLVMIVPEKCTSSHSTLAAKYCKMPRSKMCMTSRHTLHKQTPTNARLCHSTCLCSLSSHSSIVVLVAGHAAWQEKSVHCILGSAPASAIRSGAQALQYSQGAVTLLK